MNPSSSSFDSIIVGTGVAGMACALALARRGLRVSLLGPRAALPLPVPGRFDPRVYALSPASQQLLADLGAWGALPPDRVTAVQAMEVMGDRGGAVKLDAWQAGQSGLAHIVEGTELERALRAALQVFGVAWSQSRFRSLTRHGDTADVTLHTEAGERLTTPLVVAADGADSSVRAAAGLSVRRRDYDATGLVIHLNCSLAHQGTALQWFTEQGILALLPMPDTADGHQVSMVWSMPRSQAASLLAATEVERSARLQAMLAQVTGGRLGELVPRSTLHGFALSLQTAARLVTPGIALLGDAAHVVHPLAGQGLNLGLGDVQALARAIAEREPFRAPGDERVLHRYQRARAEPVAAMRFATDALYQLFNAPGAPAAWLRNTGMGLVDRLPFAKRLLVQKASEF